MVEVTSPIELDVIKSCVCFLKIQAFYRVALCSKLLMKTLLNDENFFRHYLLKSHKFNLPAANDEELGISCNRILSHRKKKLSKILVKSPRILKMTPIYVNTDHHREFADDKRFNFLNLWNYDGSVFTAQLGKTSGVNLLAFFSGEA